MQTGSNSDNTNPQTSPDDALEAPRDSMHHIGQNKLPEDGDTPAHPLSPNNTGDDDDPRNDTDVEASEVYEEKDQ